MIKWVGLTMASAILIAGGYYLGTVSDRDRVTEPQIRTESVARVIDGDTIELTNGEIVRYLDIDTPETVHPTKPVECYGPQSTERNRELVAGRTIQLDIAVSSKDKFGRTLAYVYTDEVFVNGELVWGGYAYAQSFGEPGPLYSTLIRLEKSAREFKKGLWEICGP